MQWVIAPEFAAEALTAVAVLAIVPSGVAALALARRRRSPAPPATRVLAAAGFTVSALVVLALAVFLLTNHVRIEDVVLL